MDQDDLPKAENNRANPKDSMMSLTLSLLLGAVVLFFGIQDLGEGKVVLGLFLTAVGCGNLYMAYKIWSRRRNG